MESMVNDASENHATGVFSVGRMALYVVVALVVGAHCCRFYLDRDQRLRKEH